ncbi:MAG: hypothetical protein H0W08_01670, partial [Acidobacteria bacterium]|nr:hypothetical protein [Acidobacteriota bacterium]
MRKTVIATAAVLAAVVFFLLATLPPGPTQQVLTGTDPELIRRTVRGAYHVHTDRSDGAASKSIVAAAAARAGLRFLILTDHGDATGIPDPPAYIDGVLCIDAVEISTSGGHYVALDMPPSPYPLGGAPSAVVEDVTRLGGFGIAAHPDHPKAELAWTDWEAPIAGIEWINADAEWRNEGALQLPRILFNYLLRPAPAIASVFDRPDKTLTRWDDLNRARPILALAAVDAHGGPGAEVNDRWGVIGPSYDASFRTLTNRVILERPPSGDAADDARLLLNAVRRGSVYSVVDAISPDVVLGLDPGGFTIRSQLPAGAKAMTISGDDDAHRIEVHAAGAPGEPPVPWVLSNWVRRSEIPRPVAGAPDGSRAPTLLQAGEWRVEKDEHSQGRIVAEPGAVTLRYELAQAPRQSQFVAASTDLAEKSPFSGILFRGRAANPMRVSVQFRFPPDDLRWVTSVYLGRDERDLSVPADSMQPAERTGGRMPPSESARSLLFVVDLVNARPSDAGHLV